MLFIVESKKSIREIEKAFPEVAAKHKFGVLGVHNLRQKINEKGVLFDRECLVFEVCNPLQASKVLSENMQISTALPCRISVYEEGGKTIIATIRPTVLLELFDSPNLGPVAEEVEKTILGILQDLR